MDIRIFKDIFINRFINKKSIVIVELSFIIILLLLIISFNNLYEYYNNSGEIKEGNIMTTAVNTKDLTILTDNNSMKINKKTYAYSIDSIEKENYINSGMIYKVINIKIDKYKGIDNSYVEYQIIKDKETILNYFIKTMKGG